MSRLVMACVLVLVILASGPVSPTLAQSSARPAPSVPPPTFTLNGGGSYAETVGPALVSAFDQTMQEIDGVSEQVTPTDVKNMTFRRRLVELRILMDYGAYAYDPNLLGTFRGLVDDAYERVGAYQDIDVIQTILQTPVSPDIVSVRQIRMNVALGALRSPSIRPIMRSILAAPSSTMRTLSPKDTPLLWTTAGQAASSQLDGVGNAALLGSGAIAGIQNANPYIADVFDPVQEAHFHDVRKGVRSILLLMNMFPETREALIGSAEPLFALVSQYGDVNDAFTAFRIAPTLGIGSDPAAANLRAEFVKAQARQQVVGDARSFDAVVGRLAAVKASHQR